jgi:hypothetical protein
MNIGQLMEIAYQRENSRLLPLFYLYNSDDFKRAGSAEYRGVPSFPAAHGYQYFLKLDHCAEDKVYFTTQPRNSYLGYYVKGKRNLGGMRFGEMELWGLQAHGAHALLQQLLHRYSYEEDFFLSPVVKTFGWYALLIHMQLEVSKNGKDFIPFYQEERFRKMERISFFRFRRLEQLDELKAFFGEQMKKLSTISEFDKHVASNSKTAAPGYVQLNGHPDTESETLVSSLEGMPALLVLPGSYLLSNLKKGLHDSLSEVLYYRVFTAGNRDNRFYPLVSRKGEDWGYNLVAGLISGKNGILRTHLLGRRVSSSGRAVIVPEPGLALDEVSLPAVYAEKYGGARQSLMVRYPSLFKYNIQQFTVNDQHAGRYVIKVNPLVCSMIAGDFDGDAMTFMIEGKLFPKGADRFSPVENLYHEGDGSLFLHLSQDLTYAYHLLRTHREAGLLAEKLEVDWLPDLCAQQESLNGFAEAARRCFTERETFVGFIERFVRALFTYVTEVRPYTISIKDLENVNLFDGSGAETTATEDTNTPRQGEVNHLFQIIATGARGKKSHLEKMTRQASGSVYLQTKTEEESKHREVKRDFPLSACLRDGLSPFELAFFSNDARAGLGEKKLKTPDGGEFNRRIHEILYDVEIGPSSEDKTRRSFCKLCLDHELLMQIRQAEESVLGKRPDSEFRKNVLGFLRLRSCTDSLENEVKPEDAVDQLLGTATATQFWVSSPLVWDFCDTDRVPTECFGYRNLFESEGYSAGERIGLIAASIIGEQGTQLAMKSFQGESLVPLDLVGQELKRALSEESGEKRDQGSCNADLLARGFTIYSIYGGKVRPVFIELLLAYLRDKTEPGTFNPLHYHSLPWKGGLYNLAFGFFRDNIRQLYREAEEGLSVSIDESYQYRLIFDQFADGGRKQHGTKTTPSKG